MNLSPWQKIIKKDRKEYVLECDREIVEECNRGRDEDYKIRVNNPPTPYMGDFVNAKILLLQLNPGSEIYPGLNPAEDMEFKIFKNLKQDIFKSLRGEKMKFPFYWLNPEYILTGGFRYWARIFSSVIDKKEDYYKIANRVCCIQYFPYHSRRYYPIPIRIIRKYRGRSEKFLESQKYGFSLARRFLEKTDKLIILMRGKREWLEAIPELNGQYIILKNKRNPVLSGNNFSRREDYKVFREYLGL